MKKLAIFLVFVVFMTTGLIAQERDQDRIQDQDRTNLTMVNGEMLQLRDRAHMRLKEKITLKDGTQINSNGIYITPDGKQFKLKNGECMDSDGIVYRNEYQYRYKVQQENKGLDQAQIQNRNQNRIHYVSMDGDMLQVRNQSQERLQTSMTLNNGTVVNPDGTYQVRDRQQLRLQDGECINMDGELFQNQIQHRKMLVQKNKKMMNKKMNLKKPKTPKKKIKKSIGKKV